MGLRIAVSIGMICLVGGCVDTVTTGSATVVRDSSGVTIVENRGPYEEWHLAATPEVRIGTVEGDSVYQFYRVRFAGRLSDGRIVVTDGSGQVRWYDPSGTYRSSVGRQGGGPGEFGFVGSVLITPSDTVVIHDSRNRRATWLSPSEQYVRELTLRDIPNGQATLLALTRENGLALATSTTSYNALRPNYTYLRDTLTVLRASDNQLDSVARVPGSETALWAAFSGGQPERFSIAGLPFAYRVTATATNDQYTLVDGEEHEIRYYDWTSNLRLVARRPEIPEIPLTDADRQRYVDRMVESARERGTTDVGEVEQSAKDALSVVPEGHTMPSFDQVLSDKEGRIWLRDYKPIWIEADERSWIVVGSDGHIECQVMVPIGLQVMHVGPGRVTGVERDSLDVEYVVVYRLEPSR